MERKEEKNKKYWLIPAISFGIASLVLLLLIIFDITNFESLGVIYVISFSIGIISSFFTKQKQWKVVGICFVIFIAIVIIRAIITGVIYVQCSSNNMNYGGMIDTPLPYHHNDYSGFCKILDVIQSPVLIFIQYIFLVSGIVSIIRAIYLSIKHDKN